MLGVSLSISCKNKIQCVCVEKKKKISQGLRLSSWGKGDSFLINDERLDKSVEAKKGSMLT